MFEQIGKLPKNEGELVRATEAGYAPQGRGGIRLALRVAGNGGMPRVVAEVGM